MRSIRTLIRQLSDPQNSSFTLLRSAGMVFVLQILGYGLLYLMTLLFTRWFGTVTFGQFVLLFSWLQVLGSIAELGLSQSVLKFLPVYEETEERGLSRGFLVWGTLVVAGAGIIIGAATFAIFSLVPQLDEYRVLAPAFMFTPIFALQVLFLNISRGLGNVVLAYFPDLILRPVFAIVIAIVLLGVSGIPDYLLGISAYTLGLVIVLFIFAVQIVSYFRNSSRDDKLAYHSRSWINYSIPLMGMRVNQVFFLRISPIMLGFMLNPSAVAIFAVADRIANFAMFFQRAAVAVFAPLIAPLNEKGDNETLDQHVSMIADWAFFSSILASVGIIIFSPFLLRMFGEEYLEGQLVLIVLLTAHIINSFAGPAPVTLNYTGYQRLNFNIHIGGTILAVILHVLLIPLYGVEGAALALLVSSASSHWLAYYYLKKRLGLHSLPTFTQAFHRGSKRSDKVLRDSR